MNKTYDLPNFEPLDASRVEYLTQIFSENARPVLPSNEFAKGSSRTAGVSYVEARRYVLTMLQNHADEIAPNSAGALIYRNKAAQLLVQFDTKTLEYALIGLKKLPEPKPIASTPWSFSQPVRKDSWRRSGPSGAPAK
jgi:hypothetical protein